MIRRRGTQDALREATDEMSDRYDYTGDRTRWGSFPGSLGANQSYAQRRGRPPQGYGRTDERIREDLCQRLAKEVDASDVAVAVHDGVVTFTGTVPDRRAQLALETVADRVTGVKDIHNLVSQRNPVETFAARTAH